MEYLNKIPPVIRILLDEDVSSLNNPSDASKFFRRIFPELRRQAEWSLEHFHYIDRKPIASANDFVVTATGALDPLGHGGTCSIRDCRLKTAVHFARTVGLYADIVTVPDILTPIFREKDRLSDVQIFQIANDILVLKELEPLIRTGALRFRKGFAAFCKQHHEEFVDRVEKAAIELLPMLTPELSFELNRDFLVVKMGRLFDSISSSLIKLPPHVRKDISSGRKIKEIGLEIFQERLLHTLHSVLIDMNSAMNLGSSLFSSSRFDLLTISSLEKKAPGLDDIEKWEMLRSIELPWVKQLSVQQIVKLRNEANKALPQLREKLHRAFTTPSDNEPTHVIAELRENAAGLFAELESLNIQGENRFRSVTGTLGLAISVYGFASGFASPSVALGSLLTLLGLLHSSAHKDKEELSKMKARPSYVLLKAKEISERDQHTN